MKEFIEKLIGRLEELGWVFADYYPDGTEIHKVRKKSVAYDDVISIVNELAEEYKADKVNQLAMMYAQNMHMYGVDVTKAWKTATSQSAALNEAYMRGRQYERDKYNKAVLVINPQDEKDIKAMIEQLRYGQVLMICDNDFCEWKIDGVYLHSPHDTELVITCLEEEQYRYKYCPICGKKIKAVE